MTSAADWVKFTYMGLICCTTARGRGLALAHQRALGDQCAANAPRNGAATLA